METTIVKIGNSKGLIIPKKLLSTFGEARQVDIQVKDGGLIITPLSEIKARSNWEQLFYDAIAKGFTPENEVIDIENDFDKKEWTW
jgi:antitoxin MazE